MKFLRLWVVILVKSGIPLEVKRFYSKEVAYRYQVKLNSEINEENDSTEIFELSADVSKLK